MVFDFYVYCDQLQSLICIHLYDTFQTENIQYLGQKIIQLFFQYKGKFIEFLCIYK